MTGDTHYDLDVLAELAEGLLDDLTERRVREHLAHCDACGESLADLAAVREILAAVPVPTMPLGVAMRLDRALAAEVTAGDRGRRDDPAEGMPEPVALGLVAPDGVVVPDPRRTGPVLPAERRSPAERRRARRRRPWSLPVAVAAAAAVVIGGAALATGLLAGGAARSPYPPGQAEAGASPARTHQKSAAYSLFASGHNYTSRELRGPLLGYFGVAPGAGTSDDESLDTCVKRYSNRLGRAPIGVDKALYNGNEATIMAFWEDKRLNAVRVVVVDSGCKSLRRDGLASWR